jgi:hypothetical protein
MGAPSETQDIKNPGQPLPFGVFALFTPDEAMPKDRPLRFKRRFTATVVFAALSGSWWALSLNSEWVESVYTTGIWPALQRPLAALTARAPISLAETVIFALAGWFMIEFGVAFVNVARRKRRALNALAGGGLRVVMLSALALFLFLSLWGVNYGRAPFLERQGWQAHAKGPEDAEERKRELARVVRELITETNRAYLEAHATEDLGTASFPFTPLEKLDAEIDVACERMAGRLKLDAAFSGSRGPAKPVAASELMSRLMIGGFYFPWTGEANFNYQPPAWTLPHTIAHEKAHQRGVTSEDECNFLGFLACLHAQDPFVRYSALLFGQRQLLSDYVSWLGREGLSELLALRLKGVQRDVDASRDFWKRQEGTAGEVSREINHAYLISQGVAGGIESYSRSSTLILAWVRLNGGRVMPGPARE